MLPDIEDNSLVIVKDSLKEDFIESLRKDHPLYAVKTIGLKEFKKKFYFDYGIEAVHHVSKTQNCIRDIAEIYLENLYYIGDLEDEKIDLLKRIKSDLDNLGLLEYTPHFRNFLKNKKVYLYGLEYVDKFYEKMFEEVRTFTAVTVLQTKSVSSKKELYALANRDQEIFFVASRISELLKSGIDIHNIKLANVSSDYRDSLQTVFKDFHIPLNISRDETIKSTLLYKRFKEHFSMDFETSIKWLEEYAKSPEDRDILDKIVGVLNRYSWARDKDDVASFILEDAANIPLKDVVYYNAVTVTDFREASYKSDDYVFLLNFNQGIIPVNKKDEDFLNDETKNLLGLSDSVDINKKAIAEIQDKILKTSHLTVTYAKRDLKGDLYISSAYKEDLFEEKVPSFSFEHSDAYNKKLLVKEMDEFKKYGTKSPAFQRLASHYKDEPYDTYDNSFKGIDPASLREYMGDKLTLSYSSMNTFYKCSFRYYLDNVLKVNKFEDTFEQVVGTIFHEILAVAFKENFDFDKTWDETVAKQEFEFKSMEKFFLGLLREEVKFVIDSIHRQYEATNLKDALYEQKVVIDVDKDRNVVFKGFIDKILYGDSDVGRTVSIIDYKTGNPDLSLDNCIYGLEMQLPIYSYLIKHIDGFENAHIGGFYLQKILNNINEPTAKYNALKLQGYSTSDINVLKEVDKDYRDSNTIRSLKMGKEGFYPYSRVLDNEKFDKLNELVGAKIKEASDKILSADFAIDPKEVGDKLLGCEFCTYRDICYRKNKDIVQLKKANKNEFLGGDEDAKVD